MDDELEYEWEGSLPPAGMVCEGYIYADTADQGRPMNRWVEGEFIGPAYASNGGIGGILKATDGRTHFIGAYSYFRPIRTPEQIAAEERELAINSMKKVFDSCSHQLVPTSNKYLETLFGAIHDAGWKRVQP